MAPVEPAIRVTEKAPQGELYRFRGGHYDVYQGGRSFDDVLRVEVEFLHKHGSRDALRSSSSLPGLPAPSSGGENRNA
jgi:hypothetical protein